METDHRSDSKSREWRHTDGEFGAGRTLVKIIHDARLNINLPSNICCSNLSIFSGFLTIGTCAVNVKLRSVSSEQWSVSIPCSCYRNNDPSSFSALAIGAMVRLHSLLLLSERWSVSIPYSCYESNGLSQFSALGI